ncbi:MAG: carboxy terminal-processing peptidase [Moraxellaceae bacterium]
MKLQNLACALALITGGLFFNQVMGGATPATAATTEPAVTEQSLMPSREQALVSRQVATLLDRHHYLNMPMDETMSVRIFDMLIDNLDAEHTLFLQSDIDSFRQKYAANLGRYLKTGDLRPAFEIHQRYQQRLTEFNQYMLNQLKQPQNLNRDDTIEIDREKAPFFATQAEQQAFWQKQLVSQLINLTISKESEAAKQQAIKDNPALAQGQDLSSSELGPVETLQKRYQRQLERMSRVKSDRVLELVLNAAMATYDPHSNYYAPVEAMEMNRQTTLALEGIGVSIRPERGNEDYTRIESLVEGGPSSKNGQVRAGDRIIGVAQDGEAMVDVVGWSSGEIVGLIRGKRGTKVTLRLLAPNASAAQARNVTIVRDVIEQEDAALRHRITEVVREGKTYRIGVIEIPSFYLNYRARRAGDNYRSVSEDTKKALLALSAENVDGVVVDLRNNPGGSLDEVASMLGMFLKEGSLVQIRDGNGNVNVYRDEDGGAQLYAGPLTVLINLASASASEIFAAAIQDYGRGLILGSTTTGKGTAQVQLDSLAYGQATLTQRTFYRVTGGSTQNRGVSPDIHLVNIYDEEMGERKAKNALKWDTIATSAYVRERDFAPDLPVLNRRSLERQVKDPQFVFLNDIRHLGLMNKDQKTVSLNLDTRRAEAKKMEQQTLAVENQRRVLTGLPPYASWQVYQADLEAQSEIRAKMKQNERPKLPEDEVFVVEAADVLVDSIKLQRGIPLTPQ